MNNLILDALCRLTFTGSLCKYVGSYASFRATVDNGTLMKFHIMISYKRLTNYTEQSPS